MNEQIIAILKSKLQDLTTYGQLDAETRRNALKEELQFFILNFIYHHPKYSKWIMYGGSALRIIHGLDRMSVDLDFEVSHTITKLFLTKLKKELENHFTYTYGTSSDFLTIKETLGRGLLLKFHVGDALSFGHQSNQVHVKIDLNHFTAPKMAIERRPINRAQLSFVVVTYNMAALMASKIAAIFLRGTRGVGEAVYTEKGRDIYDLLWYMNQKVVPDFDYFAAKQININNLRLLFNTLTLQMNKVSDINLKQDLMPLFTNQAYIENWLKNWRESYFQLLGDYKIHVVTKLEQIRIHRDLIPDNFYFIYTYKTEDNGSIRVMYAISEDWIGFSNGNLPIKKDEEIKEMIEFTSNVSTSHPPSKEKLKQYAMLFYQKTAAYLTKTNQVILGNLIQTKLIRMTAAKFDPKEQILLSKSTLLSCELDDLLK